MYLHQFDYIFAIGMLFAFLDAWNIGANDVANSFASSVSSRSLKYWQAMILAALCELLGAVLAGSRVSDTIRNKIVDVTIFKNDPASLMITMACALVGSSVWLSIATSIGMPVSTTHSIVGAVIGSSIAAKGGQHIHWGWSGVSQIIASWFIAPILAGCFATIVFLISKFFVLDIKDSRRQLRHSMLLGPVLVFVAFAILTMLIVWKGSPKLGLSNLPTGTILAAIFGTAAVAMGVYILFLFPYYRRKLVHEDWTLKWYDIFRGPIFFFKSTDDIPPMPEGHELTIDYYEGRRYDEAGNRIALRTSKNTPVEQATASIESSDLEKKDGDVVENGDIVEKIEPVEEKKQTTRQLWWSLLKQPSKWPYLLWLVLSHGFTQDVINNQNKQDMLTGDLSGMHQRSKYYPNKIEYMYSILQAITAGTMSFAHGSNDIANAAGPLSTIYLIWSTNKVDSKAPVPLWVLGYTAAALVIGCWTYGYRIMANLGNKLILQSPSRGFSIELGAAVTTVIASQLAIPVSTTQSAVGATVFIGLCNMELKTVNWRMVLWCYLGWIFTLPCAGLIAGLINGIIIHAPRLGAQYELS
ncbi:hypothetical protein G9P44_001714 [Scheffersomyces stipitis]|nr:hypothetical protein G9P44_001714 [Scheffersomyces stipitis]